jgi:hypothetical protein
LAPVPLQVSQFSCFSNSIVFSAPLATSAERKLDLSLEVEPARASRAGPAPRPCRAATAPESAEDLVEHREDVAGVHVGEVVLPLDAGVAELVVAAALGVVGEDLVRLGALLERRLRPRPCPSPLWRSGWYFIASRR